MVKGFSLFLILAAFGGIAVAQTTTPGIILGPGPNQPAPAQINPGSTDNPGVQFALASGTVETFTELYIKNAGSAGASDFTQLTLYRDVNDNGIADNGDVLVTTFASGTFPVYSDFSSNPQTIGIGSASITATSFLVTIDVAPGATTGATFELTITAAGTICSTNVTGQDVQGATQTVANGTTPNPVSITTTSLNDGAEGSAYNETITATGGTGPYSWSGTSIPAFLTLDTNQTGLSTTLSGAPTTGDAGTYSFTVRITDSTAGFDDQSYTIDIIAAGSGVIIITTTIGDGTVGLGYNETIASAGGAAPYTWSLSAGALPPGLVLDTASTASTTTITGTPTTDGTFNFTVQVVDAGGSDSENYTVVITQPGGGGGGSVAGGGGGGGGGCVASSDAIHWMTLGSLLILLAISVARRCSAA